MEDSTDIPLSQEKSKYEFELSAVQKKSKSEYKVIINSSKSINDKDFVKVPFAANEEDTPIADAIFTVHGRKCDYYFKKTLRAISILIQIALSVTWIYCYHISLEGCQKQQNECLSQFSQSKAVELGIYLLISSSSFTVLLVLTLVKLFYKIFLAISVVALIFLFFFSDNGADLASHGSYNRAFFITLVFLFFMASLVLFFLFKIFLKHPTKTAISVAVVCISAYFFISHSIKTSCDYFNKGMKNSIVQKGGQCPLPIPETCFLYYTSNFFDVSAVRMMECSVNYSDEEIYELRRVSNKTQSNRLGFPRTEYWKYSPDSYIHYFHSNVFSGMIDMDDPAQAEKAKEVEVEIDYMGYYPEVHIQVKRNETLVKERSEKYKTHQNQTLFKNILYIYIDSLSRNHMKRKLKMTYEWLEKHYNTSDSQFATYQFLKYHSIEYYTYANMIPGYFGTKKFDGSPGDYFLYQVKDAGYITGQSNDICSREVFDLEPAYFNYYNFTNYDHEMNGFYCDPSYSDPEQPYGIFKGAYSIVRRCLYRKDAGIWQLDYTKQFFDVYADQPKFFRVAFNDAHEGTGEVVKYIDGPIVNMLDDFLKKGHLKDTLVILQSDHGFSMAGPVYFVQPMDYFYEIFLPTLVYFFPRNVTNFEKFNENLKFNENRMITPFDTHAVLLNLFNLNHTKTLYGLSLFNEKVIDDDPTSPRKCENFGIEGLHCMCNYLGYE